jgi:hypothetical protein
MSRWPGSDAQRREVAQQKVTESRPLHWVTCELLLLLLVERADWLLRWMKKASVQILLMARGLRTIAAPDTCPVRRHVPGILRRRLP